MNMSARTYFLFLILLCFFPTFISGESIILKDGSVLKGKVSSQNAYNITVKTEDGKNQEISKTRILKIVYKDVSNEEALRIKKEEEAKQLEKEQKKKEQEDKKKEEEELSKKAKEEKQKQELLEKQAKDADAQKKEQERLTRLQQKGLSPWGVAWRSAVLPGWGQWTDERKLPAIIYSSLLVGSLYLTYRENQIYKNSVKDLNHMNNPYETLIPIPSFSDPVALYLYNKPFEEQRKNVNDNYHNFQMSLAFTVILYAMNVFDAYFFHPKFAKSAAAHLILDYNPMVRLDSSSNSNSSASIESYLKFGLRFPLE